VVTVPLIYIISVKYRAWVRRETFNRVTGARNTANKNTENTGAGLSYRGVSFRTGILLLVLFWYFFLVLLVNDSEYSKSADAKPILSPGCIYLVSLAARRNPISGC
jgi:hypothetical protein